MEIKKRNTAELEYSIIVLILTLAPIFITLQLNLLAGKVFYIFLFGFFYSILFFYIKKDNLKKEEIEYLQEEAELEIKHTKNELQNYAFILMMPLLQFLYLDYGKNPNIFIANVLLIVLLLIFIAYKYFTGKHFSVERLFLTNSQIIFLGSRHVVINKANIKEVRIEKNKIEIKEKHGDLILKLDNWDFNKMDELKTEMKKLEQSNLKKPRL